MIVRLTEKQLNKKLHMLSKTEVAIRLNKNDEHSHGKLFYMFCDDIQDMDLTNTLQSLMALFVNIAKTSSAQIIKMIKNQVCS